jgi:hypothetical protein
VEEKSCEYRGQVAGHEGLPQDRSVGVAIRHLTVVARSEEERHISLGEHIRPGIAVAAFYRHKAGNMQAIMQAYDRLHAKGA